MDESDLMKKLTLYLNVGYLFIPLILCAQPQISGNEIASAQYQVAVQYKDEGAYQDALDCINVAIRADDSNAYFYWMRANILWSLYREFPLQTFFLHQSEEDWLKAMDLKKEDGTWCGWGDVYLGLGKVEQALGKREESIKYYEYSFQHTSDLNRKLLIALAIGNLYSINDKWESALSWFSKVPDDKYADFDSCLRYALCNHRMFNYQRAENLYLKALSIKPDNVFANTYLAHLYAEQGLHYKAIGYLKIGLTQTDDLRYVFNTLSTDVYTSAAVETTMYLELFWHFFDRFCDELRLYKNGDFAENGSEIKKLRSFQQSVNKVVIPRANSRSLEVSEYAKILLEKIEQAGLLNTENNLLL